jgi:hypothetical protein
MFKVKKIFFLYLFISLAIHVHAQYNNNLLKFNLAGIAFGDFEFSYEKQLNEITSLEVSVGPTYKNFAFEAFQPRLFNSDFDASEPRKNKLGYSLKLAYRIQVFKAFYLSPQIAQTRYNYEYSTSNIYAWSNETIKEKIVFNDIRFLFGFNFDVWADKINLDIGSGFAFRQRNIHFFEEQSYYQDNKYHVAFETYHSKHNVPAIVANFKLGFYINQFKKQ